MWQIIINGPGYFDTTYELPEGVTSLGRADENDIVLGGDLVSRRHARLHARGGSLLLEDLGSRNGSRVNGQSLTGTADLYPGDTVQLGENTLSVRQPMGLENVSTEMVKRSPSGVYRYGQGETMGGTVILAKNVRDADVLRALDNFAPTVVANAFEVASPAAGIATPRVAYETVLVLYKTAEALATAPNLQSFLNGTMDRLLERLEATTAVVLLERAQGVLSPAAVRHRGRLAQGEVPVSDAIVTEALKKGSALVVEDVRDDRRFADRESVLRYSAGRVLCIPVGAEPPFLGVLYVNTHARGEQPLELMLDTCTAMAHLIAAGIQKFLPGENAPVAERLRRTLERFHPAEVAERRVVEAMRHEGKLPGLEEKRVTALAMELTRLPEVVERLGPARTTELLAEFRVRMTGLIFSFEGAIVRSVGGTMLALFGEPSAQIGDAARAVRAGLALIGNWTRAAGRRPEEERCGLRIGLSTGKALVGILGPEARPELTVLGEPPEAALQLAARADAGKLLVTGKTLAELGARFDVRPMERRLPPPFEKLPLYEVLGEDAVDLTQPGR